MSNDSEFEVSAAISDAANKISSTTWGSRSVDSVQSIQDAVRKGSSRKQNRILINHIPSETQIQHVHQKRFLPRTKGEPITSTSANSPAPCVPIVREIVRTVYKDSPNDNKNLKFIILLLILVIAYLLYSRQQ